MSGATNVGRSERVGTLVAVAGLACLVVMTLWAASTTPQRELTATGAAATEAAVTVDPVVAGDDWRDCLGPPTDSSCLVEQLTAIARSSGPDAAFTALDEAEATDPTVAMNCHMYLHAVGQGAGEGATSWFELMGPGRVRCNFGYAHGVVEGALATTAVSAMGDAIMELCAVPSGSDSNLVGNCGHGAGHAALTAARWDVRSALEVCSSLDAVLLEACGDGTFMAYANALSQARAGELPDGARPESFEPEGALGLCASVSDDFKRACYLYAGPTWAPLVEGDAGRMLDACPQEGRWADTCALGVGRGVAVLTGYDPVESFERCGAREALRNGCVGGAAENISLYRVTGQTTGEGDVCASAVPASLESCRAGVTRGSAIEGTDGQ